MISKFGNEALKKLLADYAFNSVLDIGSGSGDASIQFLNAGKKVTMVDLIPQPENTKHENCIYIQSDFNKVEVGTFDCVWCSHTLEHQLNVNSFLVKLKKSVKENGIICTTVPPMKHDIVGGHVTVWNAGLLLYNLVMAGLNCSQAKIKTYGYNISVIVKKKQFNLPKNLKYDEGDIQLIHSAFPFGAINKFNGNIKELNWNV